VGERICEIRGLSGWGANNSRKEDNLICIYTYVYKHKTPLILFVLHFYTTTVTIYLMANSRIFGTSFSKFFFVSKQFLSFSIFNNYDDVVSFN